MPTCCCVFVYLDIFPDWCMGVVCVCGVQPTAHRSNPLFSGDKQRWTSSVLQATGAIHPSPQRVTPPSPQRVTPPSSQRPHSHLVGAQGQRQRHQQPETSRKREMDGGGVSRREAPRKRFMREGGRDETSSLLSTEEDSQLGVTEDSHGSLLHKFSHLRNAHLEQLGTLHGCLEWADRVGQQVQMLLRKEDKQYASFRALKEERDTLARQNMQLEKGVISSFNNLCSLWSSVVLARPHPICGALLSCRDHMHIFWELGSVVSVAYACTTLLGTFLLPLQIWKPSVVRTDEQRHTCESPFRLQSPLQRFDLVSTYHHLSRVLECMVSSGDVLCLSVFACLSPLTVCFVTVFCTSESIFGVVVNCMLCSCEAR